MQKDNLKHEKQCVIRDVIANFLCGVGLETAKYIKELGFNKPTHWYWQDKELPFVEKGLKRVKYKQKRMNHNKYDEWIYSAPTRDELLRWEQTLIDNCL